MAASRADSTKRFIAGSEQYPTSSPPSRRAVRGKLCIAEADLVRRGSVASGGRIDLGRTVDLGDRLSYEQRCCDEPGEAYCPHDDAVFACGDAQQQIGDHGGKDLQVDGILGAAKKLAKLQMLLDPTEQQFDLPAGLVKPGDFDGRPFQVVGDEGEFCAIIAPDANAAHRYRKPGLACADELHLGIVDDGEAIALSLAERTPRDNAKARVDL